MKGALLLIGGALAVQWGMLLGLGLQGWGLGAVIPGSFGLVVDAACMVVVWTKM